MRPLGRALTQPDWCPIRRGDGDTQRLRGAMHRGVTVWQGRRGIGKPRRHHLCGRLDLGAPASGAARRYLPVVQTARCGWCIRTARANQRKAGKPETHGASEPNPPGGTEGLKARRSAGGRRISPEPGLDGAMCPRVWGQEGGRTPEPDRSSRGHPLDTPPQVRLVEPTIFL